MISIIVYLAELESLKKIRIKKEILKTKPFITPMISLDNPKKEPEIGGWLESKIEEF